MKKIMIGFLSAMLLVSAPSCRKDQEQLFGSVNAHDFLSDQRYDRLIVEVCYVEGYQPSNAAMDQLRSFLDARLNKSAGITIETHAVTSPGKSSLDLDDVKDAEKKYRSRWSSGHTLTAFVFFADASYADNSQVLGLAYGPTSIVVFERTIEDVSGGIGQPSRYTIETIVGEHEFGHLMGLVDNGSKMVNYHLDQQNGKHCSAKDCLMYYSVETTDLVSNLIGSNIPELDTKCLEDLRSNGGK